MKFNLGTKLFLSYLVVMLVGVLVLVIVAQVSLPGAYGRHVAMMSTSGMMGTGAGRGQGAAGGSGAFQDFRSGFYEALGWAGLAALAVALIISLFISRGLAAPLRTMMRATQRVADGNYDERVPANSQDEFGQLAVRFNSMAEKLEQVESMRRRLIGDVAHELRTPLTAIKGSMEGLVDGVLPATSQTFQEVGAEADRLSRLVDDLQELSRVESGAFTLNLELVSWLDLADSLNKRLAGAYQKKNVTLTFNLPVSLPGIRADADRLLQILTNLLNNSLQHTPVDGSVTLSARKNGQEILIQVSDTGIGIPAEHLPHLFERFYRVDASRSRQAGGSGIGLTIAKYLVEAHGGRIWVESSGEGKGSTFSFTIPVK